MDKAIQKNKDNIKNYPARCDIFREEDKVVLTLEMAGVNKDSLDISVEGDKLIIKGRKIIPKPDGAYRIREIREGNFHQEFTIDDTIDRENIEATIKNGLARIILSVKESQKPRMIKVNVK